MAWIECGAGGMKETLIWENPSPTAQMSNNAAINLNASLSSFDLIKIEHGTDSYLHQVTMYIKPSEIGESSTDLYLRGMTCYVGGRQMARLFYKSNDTTITVTGAKQVGGTYGANSYLVPQKIYGIKL